MRIDSNSIDFLMQVLSDLYSDPQLAVIREYSVNARDSHTEAGVTRPIEIITPTRLSPYFKVQDYGVGLGLDDLRNIYSAYGASTKRNSNEQVGMLGLGSKSGLTISGQFTIVAIKDGTKAHVVIKRTETGGATMEIVDTNPTTDHDGVLISIPVGHNAYGFEEKVANFFKYWPAGSVLVNGIEPKLLAGDEIAPGIRVVDNPVKGTTYSGDSYTQLPDVVIMGGIAYPIDSEYTPGFRSRFHIVFDIPIGSVNFAPSRELLHYTKQTKETIADCYARYDAAMAVKVNADINAATDLKTALETMSKWADRLGYDTLPSDWKYKGDTIPDDIGPYEVALPFDGYSDFKKHKMSIFNAYGINRKSGYYYSPRPLMIIHEFPMDQITSYAKNKISSYMQVDRLGRTVYVTKSDDIVNDKWTEGVHKVTWKHLLAKTRAPKNNTPAFKTDAEFYILTTNASGYHRFEIAEAPKGKQIYYFEPKDWTRLSENSMGRLADELDAVIIKVYARRVDAFKKLHTTAKPLIDLKRDIQALYDSKVSESDKFNDAAQRQGINIRWIPENRIDDPELVKFIGLAKQPRESKRWFNQMHRDLTELGMAGIVDSNNSTFDLEHLNMYPLLNSFSDYRALQDKMYMDDVCDYLNTTYKKRK